LFQQSNKSIYEWSEEEDEGLIQIIRENSWNQRIKWSEMAQKLCVLVPNPHKIKTGKECCERFINHLDPALKRYRVYKIFRKS